MVKTKSIEILSAIFLMFLLLGQISFRVYADTAPAAEIKTQLFFNEKWDIDEKLQIRANYVMERIDVVTLTGIPKLTQLKASGWVEVNGKRILFQFNTTKYPTDKIYSVFKKPSSLSNTPSKVYSQTLSGPVYEIWDGITFITTQSSPLYVAYDHPDNGPYSPPTYNIHPSENSPTTLKGSSKYHHHIPAWRINDMKNAGSLTSLAGAMGSLIASLLSLPEVVSKVIALFLAIVAGVLSVLGLAVKAFVESVLQTEMGDGWTWVWGVGGWFVFVWWWQSFGRWRDWGWFFFGLTLWGGGGAFCRHVMW